MPISTGVFCGLQHNEHNAKYTGFSDLGLIPDDKIAEIRDRTDIVAVVSDYVSLKKAGANHKGLCPFHVEKSPSFNVNQQRQFFHCFGCGKSGDIFTFVGELEGKSFVEVARTLAQKAGVDLPAEERSQRDMERARAEETERARMVRLNDLAARFYEAELASPVGEKARAYLATRGLDNAMAAEFHLGFAPAGWDHLTRHLAEKKVPHELAERAGLIRRRDNVQLAPGAPPTKTTHYDLFVERVVYALTSPMGEILGFGGRLLGKADPDSNQPKYKNSPETPIYKKGENLFGLHRAKHAIRKSGRALVVEGNFDVMTLHQHGLDYTVAPQGTAITEAQVKLLGRFAREVVLMLDADPAGRAATMKVIRLFVEADLPVRVALLRASDGKKVDPDDLARQDLPRLLSLVEHAVDGVEMFFDQVATSALPTVPGKVAAIEECAPLLRAVRDPLARDLYVDRLAQLLKIAPDLVKRTLRAGPTVTPRPIPVEELQAQPRRPQAPPRKIDPMLSKLLTLLNQHPEQLSDLSDEAVACVDDEEVRAILGAARAYGTFASQTLLAEAAPEIRDAVAAAFLSDERFDGGDSSPKAALADTLRRLQSPLDLERLELEKRQAAAAGNHVRFRELAAQLKLMKIRS